MTYDNYFSGGIALLGAVLSWFLGDIDGVVKILIVMAVTDQLTGLIKAGVQGKWSSEVGFKGIVRKMMMFIIVGIAHLFDMELPGNTEVLRDAVSFFYVANEGLSIIENAIESGLPVPDTLKERFMTWRNKKLTSKNTPADEEV